MENRIPHLEDKWVSRDAVNSLYINRSGVQDLDAAACVDISIVIFLASAGAISRKSTYRNNVVF